MSTIITFYADGEGTYTDTQNDHLKHIANFSGRKTCSAWSVLTDTH